MTGATIPATMVPWHGGDSAPADWDGGPTLRKHGGAAMLPRRWHHIGAIGDVIAYTPLADQPSPPVVEQREAVARIVNPIAFRNWQSMYDYCLRQGDDEPTARRYADDTHKPDCDKAFATADAILTALSSPASVREAEQRAIALVRRIAAKEPWQSHYGRTWEDEAAEIVAALAPAAGGE